MRSHQRRRALLVTLLGGALCCLPGMTATATAQTINPSPIISAASVPLRDLVIDQIGTIIQADGATLGFTPEVTTYSATAYYHRSSVTVYPIATAGATVSVETNGSALQADSDGRYRIALTEGRNAVKIKATLGNDTRSYSLTITKVATDYRGNVPVTGVTATANRTSASGHDVSAMLDADASTYWTDATAPVAAPSGAVTGTAGTGFTLTLPSERYVSRLNLWGSTNPNATWQPDEAYSNAAISVSRDGQTWTTIVDRAALRADQGMLYWDLAGWYPARYIRVTLGAVSDGSVKPKLNQWTVNTVEVWARPERDQPPSSSETGAAQSVADKCADSITSTYGNIPRAQKLAICQGLTFPTWMPSQRLGRGTPTAAENALFGGLSPMFYDPPLANADLMESLDAHTPWSIAKAPYAGNGLASAGAPKDFIPESMRAYTADLSELQYGDEGGYSTAEVDRLRQWFDFSKQQYPQALVHSNQYDDGTWAANLSYYVKTAKPDLLSWDTYYWGGGGVFGSHGPTPENTVSSLLSNRTWQAQRKAGLEGLTGDGSQPILFGQYLDMFDFNGSQSQKSLVTNLGLATGQKWFGFFRLEYNSFDGGSMVDVDGAPLRSAYEYSDVITRAKNLSRYLMPLNNQWALTNPGQHMSNGNAVQNNVTTGWKLGRFSEQTAQSAQWGIKGMQVSNVGTVNNGLPGDVVVGYFNALPGLSTTYAQSLYGTSSPKAFVITNGLTGYTEHGVNGERPATMPYRTRYDNGQYWQTAQRITLDLIPGARLKMVDSATGEVSDAPVVTSNGRSQVELTLGGGQSALFFWESDPAFYDCTDTVSPEAIAVDSEETQGENAGKANAVDGNPATFWHTQWYSTVKPFDPSTGHWIVLKVPESAVSEDRTPHVCDLTYQARQDANMGRAKDYHIYTSDDGNTWSAQPVASGTLDNTAAVQSIPVNADARYIKFMVMNNYSSGKDANFLVASEITMKVRGVSACSILAQPEAVAVDSEEKVGESAGKENAVDGNPSTFWHTQWYGTIVPFDANTGHWISLKVPGSQASPHVCDLTYQARQDAAMGRAKDYRIYTSDDGVTWSEQPVITGTLADTASVQTIPINADARYIKFMVMNNYSSGKDASFLVAAELAMTVK